MTKKITIDPKFKTICKRLMKQIEMVDFTDQVGLKLTNNDAYRHFKDTIIKDG